jgi:hypothetical protein
MLVACRPAGLSALETHYAGLIALTQTERDAARWGLTRSHGAADSVRFGWNPSAGGARDRASLAPDLILRPVCETASSAKVLSIGAARGKRR